MYHYEWDKNTYGYKLTTQTGRFVANEIRPVFAPELTLTGLGKRFVYDKNETRPLLWGLKNTYIVVVEDENGNSIGRKIAQLNGTQYGKPLSPEFFFTGKFKLKPVNIEAMLAINAPLMEIIVADTKRRTKELYDNDIKKADIAYIAFSGGKDSIVLLDICHRVLPLSVPVIFSDTDMELPDTYKIWSEIQTRYSERDFAAAKAEVSALENWRRFAPPSRTIRWCCSVHKSTPALMFLKDKLHKSNISAIAFVGVRSEESHSRSFYEDSPEKSVKNASQLNRMPILDWGSHELWLYIFANDLLINAAYKKGLTRVGCLLCPESSEKYAWFVNKIYPRSLKPYNDIITETSSKNFKNATEKIDYIGSLGWQARRSGIVLKETITPPLEEFEGLTFLLQSPHFTKELFYEWIKTLGLVVKERRNRQQHLKLPNTLDEGIPFVYETLYVGGGKATFKFRNEMEKSTMLPLLRAFARKLSACVSCRSCESECMAGAITIKNNKIMISSDKCVQCRKCYDINTGNCWRYFYMCQICNQKNILVGISTYKNFGLRKNWLPVLVEKGNDFFPWVEGEHPLGKDMVGAASAWFPQAMLIDKSRKPTVLVELFRKYGEDYDIGWDFIWLSLVNNAVLVKWFVQTTEIGKSYTTEELSNLLVETHPAISKSAKDCGIASLKDMFTKSPLGGDETVNAVEMKGRTVKSITRVAKEVHPLVLLCGLYIIAANTDRSSFTVRELMTANSNSAYISPLVAFGIATDTFKKQCEGLKSKYPDYIETTFTHGNDELTIFPAKYTAEDIIMLALGE